jgi:hypothetical protein
LAAFARSISAPVATQFDPDKARVPATHGFAVADIQWFEQLCMDFCCTRGPKPQKDAKATPSSDHRMRGTPYRSMATLTGDLLGILRRYPGKGPSCDLSQNVKMRRQTCQIIIGICNILQCNKLAPNERIWA